VYVFGGSIETGGAYVDYVVPAIILLCAGYGSAMTAVTVSGDMAAGVIDRFRSLPIFSSAVLAGHFAASLARNLLSTAIVVAVALAIGFDPSAGAGDWLAALGVLLLFMTAVTWSAIAYGLLARSPEAAGAFSFFVLFLPYVSSAFVDPDTMPGALGWIAEHQPMTPIVETLRALLLGGPVGDHALVAITWCAGAALAGFAAAALLFSRRSPAAA
jgi:ABC-2 type transport system permease protein